jgi:hypothetical protein
MASTGEVPQAPASAELPPFPEKGVSLSFLRRFVAANQDLICPKTTAAPDKIFKSLGGLIVSANNLRLVPWNEKEIAQVESELCAIGLSSVALLREALVMELVNDDFSCIPFLERLQSTGKELLGFAPELLFARALQIEGFGDSVSMPQKQALTTSQVCREIVQPATEGTGGAYVDLLLAEQNQSASLPSSMTPLVGKATHFVSHTWSYYFADLVEGVEAFAARTFGRPGEMQEEDAFFWIDIFSVDENRAADPANALPQEWWSGTFMDASKFICTPI